MHLLSRINHHLRATGMPETKFGRLAVHDPRFVSDLRNGRQPREATVARVERYIAQTEAGA
jgi:hypothetical protein